MKSLRESLFDISNNIKSKPTIQGIRIDPELWEKCEKCFNNFRKLLGNNKTYEVDRNFEFNVEYNEEDCVVLRNDAWGVHVLCPETIWYNYAKKYLSEIPASGYFDYSVVHPDTNILHATFHKYSNTKSFSKRGNDNSWKGYMPETISKKAVKLIDSL